MVALILALVTALFLSGGSLAQAAESLLGVSSAAALRLARESRARWTLGNFEVRHLRCIFPRIRAELLDTGRVVARLRVDPATGDILAEDECPTREGNLDDLAALRPTVERALHRLEIGNWTWPTEQGRAWGVPLRYGDRVVGILKVDVRQGLLTRTDED